MADRKWLPILTPETPLEGAAKRAIGARIAVICEYLPLAAEHAERDVEYIHQLRVATRRAGAALTLFEACLTERHGKALRKSVTRLRRAAGSARDWDVFILELRSRRSDVDDAELPGIYFLIGYALGRRAAAQETLLAVAKENGPKELDRLWREAEEDIRAPKSDTGLSTVGDLAREHLPRLIECLNESVAGELEDHERLHEIRIEGKRLRYAVELLSGCCKASSRNKLYRAITELQEILGRLNDSHVAAQRLKDLGDTLAVSDPDQWKRVKPGLDALRNLHEKRIPQERDAFTAWAMRWHQLDMTKLRRGLFKV